MRERLLNVGIYRQVAVGLGGVLGLAVAVLGASKSQSPAGETVACRVLEASTTERYGVTLIVFHHRDQNDSGRLGLLLRKYSGGSVEFQTPDGAWHPASVFRLKSCFGRGLLICQNTGEGPAEGGEFVLRFPRAVQR